MGTLEIHQYYVTFGVQYSLDPEKGVLHPLGVTGDSYAVIEAPDIDTAYGIASAVFDSKYAFLYLKENFIDDGTYDRWYSGVTPDLTIKWVWREERAVG